jgi:hypothetical protein
MANGSVSGRGLWPSSSTALDGVQGLALLVNRQADRHGEGTLLIPSGPPDNGWGAAASVP